MLELESESVYVPKARSTMIQLKTPREIERMKVPAAINAEILAIVRENCVAGASTYDLDKIAEEEAIKRKGKPTFKGYRGFPASLCTSINHEVVHGIPSETECSERRRHPWD